MKKLITAIALISLFGCNVQQKQISKLHEYNHKYPGEAAKDCTELFPVKNTEGPVIYKPANNIDFTKKIDSLKNEADILRGQLEVLANLPNDTANLKRRIVLQQNYINTQSTQIDALKRLYKPCNPDTVIKTVYVTDMAQLRVMEDKFKGKSDSLIIVKTQLATQKKSTNTWRLFALGLLALIAGFLSLKFLFKLI